MDDAFQHRQNRAPLAARFAHRPRDAGQRIAGTDERDIPGADGAEGGVTLWLVVME
jgi:hypothetical protein